ncbi:MAG: VWA domain-containing protein, partial [Cytophagales bacterium]|nr:VWA domain-containing protein [Cytophagales bacterium]
MKQFIQISFFVVYCLLSTVNCFSQVFDKTVHDFGTLADGSNRVADFTLSNNSNEVVYILTSEYEREINLRYSTQKIAPDSSAIIRIKYNPTRKGIFNKKIRLYISSSLEPVVLGIKGKVYFIDKDDDPECPNFDKPASNTTDLHIEVFNMQDKTPVTHATVKIFKGYIPIKTVFNNAEGKAVHELHMGQIYHLIVEADGFYSEEHTMLVNKITNTAAFYLEPVSQIEEEKLALLLTSDTSGQSEESPQLIDTISTSEQSEESPQLIDTIFTTATDTATSPVAAARITNPSYVLPEDKFTANNIVFLIDVSWSMGDSRKLDLLKTSIIEMLQILRNIDRIAVITFAANTKIAVPSSPADEKEKIIEIIQNLVAGGATAGSKGIRKAYEVADDNYIDGGNNQVILATDGIFSADRALQADINNMAKSGITLSVVGIKADKDVESSLKQITEKGEGHYINIETFGKAKRVLVAEIKRNSFRM